MFEQITALVTASALGHLEKTTDILTLYQQLDIQARSSAPSAAAEAALRAMRSSQFARTHLKHPQHRGTLRRDRHS
ncbi:hypothetical protein M1116_04145 [Patescibacteria group bacterium]|nr:hypothetical protein [Patescibacteria group bacterium]